MFAGTRLFGLLAGLVLLVAGRRLYWLLVGLVGFVVGFAVTAELLQGPQWLLLVGGLLAGSIAAGIAVFFQKVALAVAGFLIGGVTVLWWAERLSWEESWWVWVLAAVAGLAGAWLVRTVFEAGLVVLSSVLGATFVLEALERPADEMSPVFIVLVAAGVLIQFFVGRPKAKE